MIIGITGTDGAGKGTVVDYLVTKRGFTRYHARDLFIEELEKQGMEISRPNLRMVANEMRRVHGNDVVVKLFLKQAREKGDTQIVIDSIRTVAEADTLKAQQGILLCVDADIEVRYARIFGRASHTDNVSLEEFIEQEKIEMDDVDPHGMQKAKVMKMADHAIENSKSKDELHKQIDEILEKIGAGSS